jgi:hypothetical protein
MRNQIYGGIMEFNLFPTRMLLRALNTGYALALFALAQPAIAQQYAFGTHTTCHLTNAAAAAACQSAAFRQNQDNDYSAVCTSILGGYRVDLTQGGTTFQGGVFASLEAGSGFCAAEFDNEIQLGGLVNEINTDLGTAETNIQNLQNYTQANDAANTTQNTRLDGHDQSITTLNDQRIAQGDLINANTTRRNEVDQILIEIDGELVDINDSASLIALDVGTNTGSINTLTGNYNNLSGIVGSNTSLLNTIPSTYVSQTSFSDYQVVRAASEQQQTNQIDASLQITNAELNAISTKADTSNTLLQNVINAQQQNENAIAVSHGKFDTQISYLSTLNPKLDTLNNSTATLVSSQQLTLERAEQTRDAVNTGNARLNEISAALYRDSTGQEHGQEISDRLDVIRDQLVNNQSFISGGMFRDNTGQEHGLEIANRLDTLNTTMSGISFDISGTNISIDNAGVESRLDTLVSSQQLTLERAEQTRDNAGATTNAINTTIANDAVYANQVNTKLDQLIANQTTPINAADFTLQQVATVQASLDNFKATLESAPIVQMATSVTSAFSNLPIGACPTPTIDLSAFMGQSVTVTEHCNLKANIGSVINPIMLMLWSLLGIRMVLSA